MTDTARPEALDAYIAGSTPEAARLVEELDEAIRAEHSGFDVAIKYHILTYAIDRDWRRWVCAVDVGRDGGAKRICVRFLWGVLLDDPQGVLRPGSSTLMTWDLKAGSAVDAQAVRALVRQAVDLYPEYKERGTEITQAAREAAAQRGTRRRT
jgi:hypothetical protein